jgi:hypothetical protein
MQKKLKPMQFELGCNLLSISLKLETESDSAIVVAATNKASANASRCWQVYKDIDRLNAVLPSS